MLILLTGASGFIGRRLSRALTAAGHEVLEARRGGGGGGRSIHADFTRDLDERDWAPRLSGVDVVINAVGLLREHGEQTFDRIHTRAPQALFAACATARVRHVVQISALGAERGSTAYFASKRAADEFLAALRVKHTIVRPSLVYGPGGTSARLFSMLASLPLIPVPGRGEQRVQPVHIDDLVEVILALVKRGDSAPEQMSVVGPEPLSLREFLRRLRAGMGLRPARVLPIPQWLMQLGARIAQLNPRSLLDRNTLVMLEMGNTADPAPTTELLGRPPRDVAAFIAPEVRADAALLARMTWAPELLRISIALVWIWSGIVSFGLYPREASYALLAQAGTPAFMAPVMLYGAATLDVLLGVGTLLLSKRRLLWLTQIALILFYMAIITVKLPQFWLHPYGPVLKNLPMLAAIGLLYLLEKK